MPEEVAHTGLAQALPSISIKAADTVRAIEEEGRTGFAIKADSADPTARVPPTALVSTRESATGASLNSNVTSPVGLATLTSVLSIDTEKVDATDGDGVAMKLISPLFKCAAQHSDSTPRRTAKSGTRARSCSRTKPLR